MTTIIERAFELARSGTCPSVAHIVQKLKAERYSSVDLHMSGTGLRRQLRQLCMDAKRSA